jgi:hypothetical protein
MKADDFHWPEGRKCAVSLTYDDGLPVHYEYVGPRLEQAGLRATFNVPLRGDPLKHPERWRALASRGHELGNHSLFHPCRKSPDFTWLEDCYDLCDYTPDRWQLELEMANLVLYLLDGRRERTFGNTCCDTTIGRGDQETPMDDILRKLFMAARGPYNRQIADPRAGVDLMQVGHFGADAQEMSLSEVLAEIGLAREIGGWIVFMIHGIGADTHNLHMEKPAHEQLVAWLGANRAEIWTAPFIEVARHVKGYQLGG